MAQTILITGASGGFGKLTTETLLSKGHTVVATMRDVEGRNKEKAQELAKLGAKVVELDVTNDQSVDTAITNALREVGGIDVVVNNAGVGVMGFQEGFTPDDFQKVFDINVFGVQRVIRAILPHFKEKKSGTIINVSSLLGRMTIPFYGPYNASKWALEALSENYRVELSQHGIDVAIVEPGGFATEFFAALLPPSDESRAASYSEYQPQPQMFFENFDAALAANPEQNPQNVADAITGVIETAPGSRAFRTIVDKMGMGDHLKGYNQSADQITNGVYGAFGIDHLLSLKK